MEPTRKCERIFAFFLLASIQNDPDDTNDVCVCVIYNSLMYNDYDLLRKMRSETNDYYDYE